MSSRKEQKADRRAERERVKAVEARAQQRAQVKRFALGIVLFSVVAGLIIGITFSASGTESPPLQSIPVQQTVELERAVELANCEFTSVENIPAGNHTSEPITYEQNPPFGGPHNPIPSDELSDATDVSIGEQPPTESWVHSLEHGRIQFQYAPSLPVAGIGQMRSLLEEDPYHVQVYPNLTAMPYEVAATAWGRSLTCKQLTPATFDAFRAFRDEFRDEAPEQVP